MSPSSPFRAAVVQAGSSIHDTPRTLARLAELAREASGLGASLVVFPEAFIGGYPKAWTSAPASAPAAMPAARSSAATTTAPSPRTGRSRSRWARLRGPTRCTWWSG